MRWECSECGWRADVVVPPTVCGECGLAGARFVVGDDEPEDDDRRAAWVRAGLDRGAFTFARVSR